MGSSLIDTAAFRQQFPMLQRTVVRDGKRMPFVYLDSVATALKPQAVIAAISNYYATYGVSVHRGIYEVSQEATDRFEAVRQQVADYFALGPEYTVIFTRGATDSLNLVAHGWARGAHRPDPRRNEVLITEMDHHANIVPWQQRCAAAGWTLRHIPVDRQRQIINTDDIDGWFTERTAILAITAMSNVTGWRAPLSAIIAAAERHQVATVIDGTQLAAHTRPQIADLQCDFFACSAHKMCGPTGLGLLIGRRDALAQLEPLISGGNMISEVHMKQSTFKQPPDRFEAGTPHIAGVIGFGAALDLLSTLDFAQVARHEQLLVAEAYRALSAIPQVEIYGAPLDDSCTAMVAFNVRGAHAHDVGSILDQEGVAVRAGHHCAQPYHRALQLDSSVRASFHLYNTAADVAALARGVRRAARLFA